MFTPAISASSTSAPAAIILNALATQVRPSPSFHWLPLPEATTTGLTAPFVSTCAKAGDVTEATVDAAKAPAAAAAVTTSRRLGVRFVRGFMVRQSIPAGVLRAF